MLKVGSLFTGIGAWEKALSYTGIPFELKFYCEFDKFADKSYRAITGELEDKNIGDITNVDYSNLTNVDVLFYSPPCQAFSQAGKQLGFEDKRGVLFFNALEVIKSVKPRVAIMENVKGLTTKKFNAEFKEMLKALEENGYTNYWQVLNTKNYGLPQNRERVFVVSFKNGEQQEFEFPKPFDSGLRLIDMLEDEVDEKFYIAEEKAAELINKIKDNKQGTFSNGQYVQFSRALSSREHRSAGWSDNAGTLCARDYKDPNVISVPLKFLGRNQKQYPTDYAMCVDTCQTNGVAIPNNINMLGLLNCKGNECLRRVYGTDGISPSLTTMQGGNTEPKVAVREATKRGYSIAQIEDSINMEQPNSKTRRGRVGKEVAQTLTCTCNQATLESNYRIRKLTPLECWRLQGFSDEDFYKAQEVNSNSQLYKQAGNSVSTCVIKALIKQIDIFKEV